jgi:TfoX/Sxy family transcriptional regulator of competence genes
LRDCTAYQKRASVVKVLSLVCYNRRDRRNLRIGGHMAYSASLAARVRQALAARRGVVEKKMFGGVGFLLHGNMLVGVWQHSLIARLGPAAAESALRQEHVRPFDVTGRPMKGWVMIDPDGIESDRQLVDWIERAIEFVAALPVK